MPQTRANFDPVLKERYAPYINKVLYNMFRILKYVTKSKEPWEGRHVRFPVHVKRSHSVGAIPAGEALPTAGAQTFVECQIPMRQVRGHLRINEDLIITAKTDKGSFVRPLTYAMEQLILELSRYQNRSAWADGTGKIGEVESYSSGTVTTSRLADAAGANINGNADNRYIVAGMQVDIYDPTGVTPRVQNAEVTSSNISNGTFVISGGVVTSSPVAGDNIYVARPSGTSPHNNDPMGIGGIVDDATYVSTLDNVSRSSYPIWNAQVINAGTHGSPGALTLALMDRLYDLTSYGGAGMEVDAIWCDPSLRRAFLALLQGQRRFVGSDKYKEGFQEGRTDKDFSTDIDFNGKPILPDRDCPWRTLFMWAAGVVGYYEAAPGHWVQAPGASIINPVPGVAGLFAAEYALMYNLGPTRYGPNCSGAMRHVSVTVDRSVDA